MKNWNRATLAAVILTTGVVTGCQSANAANTTIATPSNINNGSANTATSNVVVSNTSNVANATNLVRAMNTANSVNTTTNTTSTNSTSSVNSTSSTGSNTASSSPTAHGPTQIHITKIGTLSFSGVPQTTSSTARTAVAPVMMNDKIGYAAMNGDVLETTDGGTSFHKLSTAPEDVQAVHFTSLRDGVVVTQTGGQNMTANQTKATYTWSIYRTTNAGKTWSKVWTASSKQSQPTYESANAHIWMFGKTGYVMIDSHLLLTSNGGSTWKAVNVSGTPLDAVAITSNDLWVATTDAPTNSDGGLGNGVVQLWHSTDGGQHFTSVVKTPSVSLWEAKLSFDSKGNGIFLVKDLSTWATTVYWTTNKGQSWKNAKPDIYQGRVAQSEPVFGQNGVAWIALDPGAAPFPGGMTTFDVMTGQAERVAQLDEWRSAEVGSVQGQTVYAEASLPTNGIGIMKSTDAGKTWSQIYPISTPNVQVQFATPTFGLGVGVFESGGAIYRTNDGGRQWTTVKTLKGVTPSAIAFVNPQTAYMSAYTKSDPNASSYTVQIYATHDGGTTWSIVSSPKLPSSVTKELSESSVQTVLSASNSSISMYIDTGYPSYALTSTDGGKTWKTIATLQSKLSIDNAAYATPDDLWVSDVSQNHIPTKSNPSVYTSTISSIHGQAPATTPHALWTLPKGWTVLGMDRMDQKDAVVYATRSLYDMTQGAAIFSTHDGGANWVEWKTSGSESTSKVPQPLNLYPSGAKIVMSFPNAKDGYMLTASGMLKTTDGGASWAYVPS